LAVSLEEVRKQRANAKLKITLARGYWEYVVGREKILKALDEWPKTLAERLENERNKIRHRVMQLPKREVDERRLC